MWDELYGWGGPESLAGMDLSGVDPWILAQLGQVPPITEATSPYNSPNNPNPYNPETGFDLNWFRNQMSGDPTFLNRMLGVATLGVGLPALLQGLGAGGAAAGAGGADALTGVTVPSAGNYLGGVANVAGQAVGPFAGAGAAGLAGAGADALTGIDPSSIPDRLSNPGGLLSNLSNVPDWLSNWGPLIGGLLGAVDANNQPNSMTSTEGGTSSSTYGQQLPDAITGAAGQGLHDLYGLYMSNPQAVAGIPSIFGQAESQLMNRGSNPFASFGGNTAQTQGGFGQGLYQNTVPTSSGFASGQFQNNTPTSSGFASGQFFNNTPTMSSFANGGPQNTAALMSPFASGSGINPYLDQMFNVAADSTQNRLASEFSHAGRLDSGSHQQSRSQELQNLAAGIYGPGYESERGRQYGALESGIDRGLAQQEYNLGRTYGAQESGLARLLSQQDQNLQRQYGASESGLARLLSQQDSNLARQYGASESGLARLLAQSEGNLGRQFSGEQSDLDRLYAQMEANLGRQYGAAEGNLNRDMQSIPLQMALGQYQQQQAQAQLDAPWLQQQRYMQGLQGLLPFYPGTQTQNTTQTGSVTQPLFNNPLAGFLGGAVLGQGVLGG